MNITNSQQIIKKWESDFIQTGDIDLVPEDDRARVLHEIDVLHEELSTILRISEDISENK